MDFKRITNLILDAVIPIRCLECQSIINYNQFVCVPCEQKLIKTDWNLSRENAVFSKLSALCNINSATSLFIFEHGGIAQNILHQMKYNNRPNIGQYLAHYCVDNLHHFDGIIPIPLHSKRMKKRGYNQIDKFGQELSTLNNIPYLDHYLIKKIHIDSQVNKDRNHRFKALKNVFYVAKNIPSGHYLLIDDLITTGATLSSAVNELKKNKRIRISVLSIAFAN